MYPTTNRTPRSLRALLLDEDEGALQAVRRALEARSFSVLTARDGTSGMDLLLGELLALDVLVVELDLPRRGGRAFADLIRRAGGERDLALVVVAHQATAELRGELRAAGVDALVARSAGPDAIAEARDGGGRRARGRGRRRRAAAEGAARRSPRPRRGGSRRSEGGRSSSPERAAAAASSRVVKREHAFPVWEDVLDPESCTTTGLPLAR